MDVILIIIGILTLILSVGHASENSIGIIGILVAIVLVVTGGNISGMASTVSTVEHNNVFSLPVDGGQLEFFDPVDVTETVTHYPWYITGKDKSEFMVKGTK